MPERPQLRVAVLGFGEAGSTFARDLAAGGAGVSAYDPRFREAADEKLRKRAAAMGVRACESGREAADGADLLLSAVTAGSALDVAREAAGYLAAGQVFVDVNSVAVETRIEAARAVEAAGGRYVEAVVMGPVRPRGIAVPMLLGGPWAEDAKALLAPYAASLEVVADRIGVATAVKLSRSLMVKGIEALAVECLVTARHHGAEERVLESLNQTYPGMDWEARMAYSLTRVMLHGRRRADEMREAAKMVRAAGLEPTMALAIAERQEWVGDLDVGEKAVEASGLTALVDAISPHPPDPPLPPGPPQAAPVPTGEGGKDRASLADATPAAGGGAPLPDGWERVGEGSGVRDSSKDAK